jgi:CRISPR system Cascade subunit CasD
MRKNVRKIWLIPVRTPSGWPSSGTGRNRKIYRTRRAELAKNELNTILSSRDYRCDAAYTVVISFSSGAPYSAQQVASALNRPVFVLYLGRKSCPLSLPLSPKVIHAETVKEVFAETMAADELSSLLKSESYVVYWESGDGGYEREQVITRRDMPRSRARWQFTERKENLATVSRKED